MSKIKVESKSVESKPTRGRPRVYTGDTEAAIVRVLSKHGLTGTRRLLAGEGVQIKRGCRRQVINVSTTTLYNLACRNKLVLKRSRPLANA